MLRRNMLFGAVTPVALAATPALASRRTAPAPRRLRLRHAATGARFSGTYHNGEVVDPGALAELSAVLADSRSGAIHPFDPRALDFLWEVGQRSRIRGEFLVTSGYRTPESNVAVCGAGNSQHLRAGALDVCVAVEQLVDFSNVARELRRGGVGVYTRQSFVHLDSGPVRHWGDVSSPGGVPSTQEDLMARMAEAWAATRQR